MKSGEGRETSRIPYRRAIVVANPISGRGAGVQAASELEEGLRQLGVAAELHVTEARGDAMARLRSLGQDVDLAVCVGGDGTLREVLEGLVDPQTPVGLLPLGTANVLANELGFPRDVHHALEILARRELKSLDVMRVNGRLSFLVIGIGIDALAVREVAKRRKGPIRKLDYFVAMWRALRGYRPPRLRVTVDGERVSGEFGFVLISNTSSYANILHLAPDARIDDGNFETYLFPTGGRWEFCRAVVRGVLRHLPGGPVQMRRGRSVKVESDEAVPYQVDGDPGGETPVEAVMADDQYRLVVPPR